MALEGAVRVRARVRQPVSPGPLHGRGARRPARARHGRRRSRQHHLRSPRLWRGGGPGGASLGAGAARRPHVVGERRWGHAATASTTPASRARATAPSRHGVGVLGLLTRRLPLHHGVGAYGGGFWRGPVAYRRGEGREGQRRGGGGARRGRFGSWTAGVRARVGAKVNKEGPVVVVIVARFGGGVVADAGLAASFGFGGRRRRRRGAGGWIGSTFLESSKRGDRTGLGGGLDFECVRRIFCGRGPCAPAPVASLRYTPHTTNKKPERVLILYTTRSSSCFLGR